MNRKITAAAVFLVLFGLACGSMNRMTPAPLDNASMKADVKGKIAALYPKETFKIGVTVDSGVVTLDGQVDTAEQKARIGDAARSVNGVKNVINNITVK